MNPESSVPVVASIKSSDKFAALQEVIERTGFFNHLEECLSRAGLHRDRFRIVIKPNFMVFLTTRDPSSYTDPALVEFLVKRLIERGFKEIFVVESQNVLGKWYENREVGTVASACGFRSENYTLVDLTLDAQPHTFAGALGQHSVGTIWRDADYRISFAKNKTHPAAVYTLAMKNIFGCTVAEDKYYEYHKLREWDAVTLDMLDAFPIHFGFIDAYFSADGAFGFRGDRHANRTETILGSQDIMALDWVGAQKMGLDPMDGVLMRGAVAKWGRPAFRLEGNGEPYRNWNNIPLLLDQFDDAIEEVYSLHSWLTHLIMFDPDPLFAEKDREFFRWARGVLESAGRTWWSKLLTTIANYFLRRGGAER